MNILFITSWFESLDKAIRMQADGNEVMVYVENKHELCPGEGLVGFVENYQERLDWADLIYVDYIGFGMMVDWLREKGYNVIGSGRMANALEVDRAFGTKIMKHFGILTPEAFDFETMDEGINKVKEKPGLWVVKPNDAPSHKTYVGQMPDGSDVIGMMEYFKKYPKETSRGLQLQQRIDGVECAVSAYFNGEDFVRPFFYNLEHKRTYPGDVGENCGEMGTTIWTQSETKFFNETLGKIKPFLKKIDYRSICDINCIVTKDKIYGLEFTMRPGYPISYCISSMTKESEAEFLMNLSKGKAKDIDVVDGYGLVVLLGVPPFPREDIKLYNEISLNMPIFGITKDNIDSVHFCSTRWNGQGYECYGNCGNPLCITGIGKTLDEARSNCYGVISQIKIPNMFYRNDIGDSKDNMKLALLKDWGWI